MVKRVHIYYTGMVQGVFFRYTTNRIALSIGGISGWVKNLHDGRVELLAEGDETALGKLLVEIQVSYGSNISDKTLTWEEPTGEFHGFRVAG